VSHEPTTLAGLERALRDLLSGLFAMPAVLVAHELGVFSTLAGRSCHVEELGRALHLEARPAEALLTMCAAVGLLRCRDGRYSLTPLAEAFFLPGAATSFGDYWDMLIRRHRLYSFESLRQAIVTNTPSYDRLYPGGPHSAEERDWPTAFTRAMHARGVAAALTWPGLVDLSSRRVLLDLGGGSGVHAIAAVKRWQTLAAIVLEREPICRIADHHIAESGLEERVRTHAGDLWADEPLPDADVHFYSEVFHNHSLEQCERLARKSHAHLPPGGGILVHEMLLADDGAGPAPVAAASLNMLLWSATGKQHRARELMDVLAGAGFVDLESVPTSGYFSLTRGRRP
jgi:hypothetical protein